MPEHVEAVKCTPVVGNVYPGTWPDCEECHGVGYQDKEHPTIPCPTCQQRSKPILRDLPSQIEFKYYGRPRNPAFSWFGPADDPVEPEFLSITWAEVHDCRGVHAGTWPDCTECQGIGEQRYEVGWDGHRSDYSVRACADCQSRTKQFHKMHPNERDLLLTKQQAELAALKQGYESALKEMEARHQTELDALPY